MNSIIVATDQNYCIGKEGQIPWHCKADLQFFKKTTMGKPIIMGRTTFESIGRALPGRANIILTRNTDFQPAEKTFVCHTLQQSIELAKQQPDGVEEIMIIGGAEIYEQFLEADMIDRIYINVLPLQVEGGDRFLSWQPDENWQLISEDQQEEFTSKIYEKIN